MNYSRQPEALADLRDSFYREQAGTMVSWSPQAKNLSSILCGDIVDAI